MQAPVIFVPYYASEARLATGLVPLLSMKSFGPQHLPGSKAIYLTRTPGHKRSVLNENEVLAELRRFFPDLQVVKPSNHWRRDRRLMERARQHNAVTRVDPERVKPGQVLTFKYSIGARAGENRTVIVQRIVKEKDEHGIEDLFIKCYEQKGRAMVKANRQEGPGNNDVLKCGGNGCFSADCSSKAKVKANRQ